MKKNRVWMTMALAGLMTAGMALTSFAGWVQNGGNWYYYKDNNNEMVKGDWVTTNGKSYYLGYDGVMQTNSFIDHTYYVDETGAMVKNSWQLITDSWDNEPKWRYFSSNGRAYDEGMKQINGEYYHFSDTKMSTGWVDVDDYVYYFKDSGARATGWRKIQGRDSDDWDEYWYYFSSAGKLTKSSTKEIQGKHYIFDDEGRMLTGWVNVSDYTSTTRNDLNADNFQELRYYKESGEAAEGWRQMDSPQDLETHWYYFKDGRPYSTGYKTTVVGEYGMAKIGNDYYCFNEKGAMVTGLIEADGKYFYFDENSGKMQTGKKTVYSDEFYNEVFYFSTTGGVGVRGAGVSGVKDGYLYEDGLLVRAWDGMKYELVEVDGKEYVVSESGKVKTSGTVRDADGIKYKISKNSNGTYNITVEYN